MRILFLNSVFPGRFRSLAQFFGMSGEHTVIFLAETGQRESLPGIRRLRLAPPREHASPDPAEVEIVTRLRRGARVGNALLALRKDGFVPDLICAPAGMGGSFYIRDIFPEAFYVAYGDWFYARDESHTFFTRGKPRPPADFALGRVCNLWEYNALDACDLALTASDWQREQYPELIAHRMSVVRDGINTRYFFPDPGARLRDVGGLPTPGKNDPPRELVTFCGPLHDAARGFACFRQCLPHLLAARPRCHVAVAWLGRGKGEGGGRESGGVKAFADLAPEFRTRVHMQGALSLNGYRTLLQASTAHVYLAAPHTFSTGLLEAMACGGLVLGSDTPPVREVIRHGINGFLCDFWDSRQMADTLAGMLNMAPRLEPVRQEARRNMVEHYDIKTQTKRLADLICERMEGRNAGHHG